MGGIQSRNKYNHLVQKNNRSSKCMVNIHMELDQSKPCYMYDLPSEILKTILALLPVRDVESIRLLNKWFRQMINMLQWEQWIPLDQIHSYKSVNRKLQLGTYVHGIYVKTFSVTKPMLNQIPQLTAKVLDLRNIPSLDLIIDDIILSKECKTLIVSYTVTLPHVRILLDTNKHAELLIHYYNQDLVPVCYWAVMNKYESIVKQLITINSESEKPIHCIDVYGEYSCLYISISVGNEELSQLLIRSGKLFNPVSN